MIRSLTCAVTCIAMLSIGSLCTRAQDEGSKQHQPASTAALDRLVEQLGDASYQVRYTAAQELARHGSAAEQVLTEALADPNPEIRSRARFVLEHLRQVQEVEETGTRPANPAPTDAQRELIQRLGGDSFAARERAAAALKEQGMAARAALIEAMRDPDYEIRWRARSLLESIREADFEARLAAFVADVDGQQQHDLPGWKRYRELVGDSARARTLFAEMIRSEASLLSAYEEELPTLSELVAARVAWLRANCASGNRSGRLPPAETVAALLLVGSDSETEAHSGNVTQLYQLLSDTAMMQSIAPPSYPAIMRTLLEAWAASTASSGSTYGMMLALKYDLRETGLNQATQLLEQGTTSSSALHYAIITIGRFGDREHIPLLKPLLENKTVCHRWSNTQLKKNGTINVEVRDAALVILLHLTGKDPAQYGFKLLRENPETLYYVYTFGFIEDEEREAAHAKWAAESEAGATRKPVK